ncbi:MAG: acetate kinase [Firmicutes bacterium]|nr:acetate kinase [Bacillota bacterium]
MKILVLNSGSSSLKYQLFDMEDESVMAKGLVEKIGLPGSVLNHKVSGGEKIVIDADIPSHAVAIEMVTTVLTDAEHGVIASMSEINAVGHRTIHGGAISSSCLITSEVIAEMERLVELAPLHNPPAILGIKACAEKMPNIPMAGVFDTAFHQSMPPVSYIYGLPYDYYEKYQLRRYGFHGTSHRYVAARAQQLLGNPPESKIITCHLGNGSSVCAVLNGLSYDTSMGFTPLEGLMMGTRSGDIDPAIVTFLMDKENLTPEEMNTILNKKSGLAGISGVSSDMRYIEEAALQGNERAKLALDVFARGVVRYIGAYAAEMNGVDALVFTAGIGENGTAMREAICANLSYLGFALDKEANAQRGVEICISTQSSKLKAFVIPTNEELMIARDTLELIE